MSLAFDIFIWYTHPVTMRYHLGDPCGSSVFARPVGLVELALSGACSYPSSVPHRFSGVGHPVHTGSVPLAYLLFSPLTLSLARPITYFNEISRDMLYTAYGRPQS